MIVIKLTSIIFMNRVKKKKKNIEYCELTNPQLGGKNMNYIYDSI